MASSGTYTWSPTVAEIIDEAFERARIDPATITVYQQLSARRSLNALLTAWSNLGIHMWTVEQRTLTLVAGTASYNLPAEVIDVLDAVLRRSGVDTPMMPMGRQDYAAIPNKTTRGRPTQYFIDRQAAQPVMKLWLVPENSTDTIIYNDFRSFQDVKSDMTNTVDTPKRWLDALFDELAVRVHRKWGGEDHKFREELREVAAASLNAARMEDRERAPTRLRVRFS
jgi:hypothetical protein